MDVQLRFESLAAVSVPAVALFAFEDSPGSSGTVQALPPATRELLGELAAAGELTGKAYECVLVHRPAGLAAQRLLVVGAGKKEKFSALQLRRLAGTATRSLRNRGVRQLAWALGEGLPEMKEIDTAECVTAGALLADFDADTYRTERNGPRGVGERRMDVLWLLTEEERERQNFQSSLDRGRIIGEAQNLARRLVNEPGNALTPTVLAERAVAVAKECGLGWEVLGPEEIKALKMGAFMAVAQGSEEPPRLIILRYNPEKFDPKSPVIGLVGKGITFDSGGISIKPSENMHEMKTDMAGGALMVAVMQAISRLKPNLRVIAVVPATENLPSGRAVKPGDVVTAMSGKTIEVLNTDAEGRMVLADAIAYARQLGCTHLIDAATLTGAVMVALGNITTGVFGWNQQWVNRLLASARAAGEKMWQLPVDEDYRDLYKSTIADIANTGGRYGGAITGAMFVGEFAGDTPWVHLDIAGTRWSNEEKPYLAKGPTGVGVPTLVHLVMNLS